MYGGGRDTISGTCMQTMLLVVFGLLSAGSENTDLSLVSGSQGSLKVGNTSSVCLHIAAYACRWFALHKLLRVWVIAVTCTAHWTPLAGQDLRLELSQAALVGNLARLPQARHPKPALLQKPPQFTLA